MPNAHDADPAEPAIPSDLGPSPAVDAVDAVIRSRRTSLAVDAEAPIADAVLDELIDAANWAPNHKRTWPWRFTVITGASRGRLGAALAEAAAAQGMGPAQEAKLRTKYERAAVVLLVWVQRAPEAVRAREDRDATAAAVQNLLLAATARGLGSYWASVPDALVPATRAVAEVDEDHDLVALVYLGHPTGTAAAPPRPAPEVTWLM